MSLPTRVSRAALIDPVEVAQREFDGILGRFFGNNLANATEWAPYGVDVREDADHVHVEADLPGFRKEDVDITLENSTLTITAQRRAEPEPGDDAKGGWLHRERRYSRFQRTFTLPQTVDEQTVQARLNDGILTVTLNKREETKPRKVQVN